MLSMWGVALLEGIHIGFSSLVHGMEEKQYQLNPVIDPIIDYEAMLCADYVMYILWFLISLVSRLSPWTPSTCTTATLAAG